MEDPDEQRQRRVQRRSAQAAKSLGAPSDHRLLQIFHHDNDNDNVNTASYDHDHNPSCPPTSNPPAPLPTVGPCSSAPNTDVDFEPDTLGFNCTSGGDPDALTDITWTSWTSSQAFGNGTLTVGGQTYPDSDVTLSDPEQPAQGANAYIFQSASVETPDGLIITGSTPGEWGTAS